MKHQPPRGRQLTEEEKQLWLEVTKQDEKLPHVVFSWDDVAPQEPASAAEEKIPVPDITEPLRRWLQAQDEGSEGDGGWKTLPSGARTVGDVTGLNRRSAKRFRQGAMAMDAVLDLHGMRQEEARLALESFLLREAQAGSRCVLVITGKGSRVAGEEAGVLKRELPRWLNQPALRPHVLALAQAQPQHGGLGAFYVLLRRQR